MTDHLSILMAQFNPTVGAIASNLEGIIGIIEQHQHHHDAIIFPHLT